MTILTQSYLPKDWAIFNASSGVLATPPRGTVIPASLRISNAMYSWTAKFRFCIEVGVCFRFFDGSKVHSDEIPYEIEKIK